MTENEKDIAPVKGLEGKADSSVSPGAGAKRVPKPGNTNARVAGAPAERSTRSPRGQVVGAGDRDDVSVSGAVYRSRARKSLSVHHIQRRLGELGYSEAVADQDGSYGDLTRNAVEAFQRSRELAPETYGHVDRATLEALFEEDDNVRVVA